MSLTTERWRKEPAKIRRRTICAERETYIVPVAGFIVGRARWPWAYPVHVSSGPGNRERRPARRSAGRHENPYKFPVWRKRWPVFWQTFSWVNVPDDVGGKAKDLPVGQVRLPWAMRTQREISGHMLGYTIVYLMATDRQVFESSERKRYDILAVLHPQ